MDFGSRHIPFLQRVKLTPKESPILNSVKIYYVRPKNDNSTRPPESWPASRCHCHRHCFARNEQRDAEPFPSDKTSSEKIRTFSRSSLHDVFAFLTHHLRTLSRNDANHSS